MSIYAIGVIIFIVFNICLLIKNIGDEKLVPYTSIEDYDIGDYSYLTMWFLLSVLGSFMWPLELTIFIIVLLSKFYKQYKDKNFEI